jgi:hypothetical protein
VVAASANTNAIAGLDMTGFSPRAPANRRGETGRQDGGDLLLQLGPPDSCVHGLAGTGLFRPLAAYFEIGSPGKPRLRSELSFEWHQS